MIRILCIACLCLTLAFQSLSQISILGPGTPSGDWSIDYDMQQDTANPDLWTLSLYVTTNPIKFRQDHDWLMNWGGITFPSGIALQDGADLVPTAQGLYHISFNTATLEYSFSLGRIGINTLNPQVALDLDGALRTQPHYFDATYGLVVVPFAYSFIILNGTPFQDIIVAIPGEEEGIYLIVDNTTTQQALLPGSTIVPAGTIMLCIYTQGEWKPVMSSSSSSGDAWSLNGNTGTEVNTHALGTLDDEDLAIKTGGVERLRITATGKVGIGVSDPVGILQINSRATFPQSSLVIADSSANNIGGGVLQFRSINYDNQFNIKGSIGSALTGADSYLDFFFKSTTLMSLNGQGNLGIGVIEPTYKLDMVKSGSALLRARNILSLTEGTRADIDFSIKDYLTGRISTIGQSSYQARMGFFTGASPYGGLFVMEERLSISDNGNIGIDFTTPFERLEINGNATIRNNSFLEFGRGISGKEINAGKVGYGLFGDAASLSIVGAGTNPGDRKIRLWAEGGTRLEGGAYIQGNVSIGTPTVPTGYHLAVKGKIIAEELRCQLFADWPDYVFSKDYKLRSIDELRNSIALHGHLPGIPPASEIDQNGLDVGEMQVRMMEKIEELSLYIITLHDRIEELELRDLQIKTKE